MLFNLCSVISMNCLLFGKMAHNVKIILEKVREGQRILSVRQCGRHIESCLKHTKLAIMAFMPILLSYIRICLHYLYLEMLVNKKLDVSWQKG